MTTQLSWAALKFTAVLGIAAWAACLAAGADKKSVIYASQEVKWQKGFPSLPPGAKVAILEGDPTKPGPFVYRIKLPDGCKILPHTHPKTERLTVLSGTYHLGEGEKFDPNHGRRMAAGSFAMWPAGTPHFSWAEGETVIQVHGEGPWVLDYVNPADDPRKAKN